MADINLLQTSKPTTPSQDVYGALNKVGVVIFLVVVAFYGYVLFSNSQVNRQISAEQNRNSQLSQEIKQIPNYEELLATQARIKNTKTLLDNHLAWSKFIQAFTSATLNTASYRKFVAKEDGSATINGTVPDFKNLDKLIKGLSLPDFDFIKEVKLTNVALADSDSQTAIDFNLNVLFNKSLLMWERNAQ